MTLIRLSRRLDKMQRDRKICGRCLYEMREFFGPGCEQVSAANLLGCAEKFATAWRGKCRPARRRKSDTASLLIGRGPSSAGGQTAAWPLRAGVVFYFRRLQKKFIDIWHFCHGISFTTRFSTPFFVQRWVCAHAVG